MDENFKRFLSPPPRPDEGPPERSSLGGPHRPKQRDPGDAVPIFFEAAAPGLSAGVNMRSAPSAAAGARQRAESAREPEPPESTAPWLQSDATLPPARAFCERLLRHAAAFRAENKDCEIGFRISPAFGEPLFVDHIGYDGPDMLLLSGRTDAGVRVQIVQHVNQTHVWFVALPRREDGEPIPDPFRK